MKKLVGRLVVSMIEFFVKSPISRVSVSPLDCSQRRKSPQRLPAMTFLFAKKETFVEYYCSQGSFAWAWALPMARLVAKARKQ